MPGMRLPVARVAVGLQLRLPLRTLTPTPSTVPLPAPPNYTRGPACRLLASAPACVQVGRGAAEGKGRRLIRAAAGHCRQGPATTARAAAAAAAGTAGQALVKRAAMGGVAVQGVAGQAGLNSSSKQQTSSGRRLRRVTGPQRAPWTAPPWRPAHAPARARCLHSPFPWWAEWFMRCGRRACVSYMCAMSNAPTRMLRLCWQVPIGVVVGCLGVASRTFSRLYPRAAHLR